MKKNLFEPQKGGGKLMMEEWINYILTGYVSPRVQWKWPRMTPDKIETSVRAICPSVRRKIHYLIKVILLSQLQISLARLRRIRLIQNSKANGEKPKDIFPYVGISIFNTSWDKLRPRKSWVSIWTQRSNDDMRASIFGTNTFKFRPLVQRM